MSEWSRHTRSASRRSGTLHGRGFIRPACPSERSWFGATRIRVCISEGRRTCELRRERVLRLLAYFEAARGRRRP